MELKKQNNKWHIIETVLMIFLILAMILVLSIFSGDICCSDKEPVKILEDGWYYIEAGERIDVELPESLEFTRESFVLFNDSLMNSDAGMMITMKSAQYDAIVSYNDKILYRYEDAKFPRNNQMKSKLNCNGILPNVIEDGTLKIELFNDGTNVYKLSQVYIGTQKEILIKQVKESAFTVIIALIMFAVSIFAIGAGIYLRRIRVLDNRFINVAFFLIICSVWCLTDSTLFQQYGKHYHVNCTISFCAFMILAIPMIHFIRNTEQLNKYHILDILGNLFYINAIVQCVLNVIGAFDFIDMLFVTHLLLVIGCICVTVIILKEYKDNKTQEIQTIVLAFIILAASGIFAMVLYWSLEIPYYSSIFEMGILVFVALLLRGIILSAASNLRVKTEIDVLRRLAKEDRLTGIGNRRAFEEYMSELEIEAPTLKDALLIFIDINFLKKTNDQYGHSAGDELIIAASKCLSKTFSEYGTFFRIGGDEFCVILKNPSKKEEEWYEALENEIRVYNLNSQCPLSIAKGGSYLREDNGSMKTISDWKYQADQKMYDDKSRMRRR